MANRCTLHKKMLDQFKEYCDNYGIAYRPGKGFYQVLQVQTENSGWQPIYRRNDMPEHYTIPDSLVDMVKLGFLPWRRKNTGGNHAA